MFRTLFSKFVLLGLLTFAASGYAQQTGVQTGGGSGSGGGTSPTTYNNPLAVDAEWAFNTGSGTTVPDITGNGHDGTFGTSTAAPTWGTYGVNFLRAESITSPAQTVATNITTWASFCAAVEPYSSANTTGLAGGASPAAQFPSFFAASNNTGVSILGGAQGNNKASIGIQIGMLKTGTSVQSAVQQGYGQLHTYCVVPGIPDAYYVDGVSQPLLSANATIAPTTTTGFYQFGVGSGGALWSFKGTILYSTLSTATSWTAAQVLTETKYIQQKIAVRPLPTYPKLGVRRDQVILAGNSIFAGAFGTGIWSTHLALTNTYTVVNTSQFGKNLADMDWTAESSWITQLATPGRNIVLIGDPSNDLCGNNYTPAAAWQAAQSAIHKAIAQGAVPVIATVISRGGCDTGFVTYNNLLRNGAYKIGAAAIFDNAERQELSPNGTNNANTTFYNADATHLTGGTAANFITGYGLLATGASKIINTLDGSNIANPDYSVSNAFIATDANNYVIQTPTTDATHAIVDCAWITGLSKTIKNGSATSIITVSVLSTTVSGSSFTSSIIGDPIIQANSTGVFTSVVNPTTAGGCSWLRQ